MSKFSLEIGGNTTPASVFNAGKDLQLVLTEMEYTNAIEGTVLLYRPASPSQPPVISLK